MASGEGGAGSAGRSSVLRTPAMSSICALVRVSGMVRSGILAVARAIEPAQIPPDAPPKRELEPDRTGSERLLEMQPDHLPLRLHLDPRLHRSAVAPRHRARDGELRRMELDRSDGAVDRDRITCLAPESRLAGIELEAKLGRLRPHEGGEPMFRGTRHAPSP